MIHNISDINLWELGTTSLELQNKTWEQIKTKNNTRIRTKNLFPCSSSLKIKISSNYNIDLLWFNGEGLMISKIETNWISGKNNEFLSISVPNDAKQVGILIRFTNMSAISPSEILNTNIYYDDGLLSNNSIIAENIINIMIGEILALKMYFGNDLIWNYVPYDAEIEYLESTGTLYIDLNFYPNSTTHVIIDAQLNSIDIYYDGAGTIGSSGRNRFLICNIYRGSFHFGCGYNWSNVMQADTNRHVFLLWGDGNCAIDNQNYLIDKNCDFSLSVDSFYLFAKNRESLYIDYGAIKIYSCKIYNNDTLVKDIIPVRVGQVGYIYDKISKQLFGNQGTGNFTLGSDKT